MAFGTRRLAALLLLMALPIGAEARTGCEHLQNPFAYNECLAKSAPPAASRAPRAKGDPEASVRERRRARPSAHPANGVVVSRGGSGRRVRAVIDPWAGVRAPARRR